MSKSHNVDKTHDSLMTVFGRIDTVNFWFTNRIPRVAATRLIGRLSRINSPTFTRLALAVWRQFIHVDFSDSPPQQYRSLNEVFTRPVVAGRRPFVQDPAVWCSPSDAIVGANGTVHSGLVLQAKGAPYLLSELLGSQGLADEYEGSRYATLRLTSGMYHRVHAPIACRITQVDYLSGDVFNVNPPALRRIPGLFCRNERAVMHCISDSGQPFLIVAVAAVLVGSIRLHCLPQPLTLSMPGNTQFTCDHRYNKGAELGWFELGSTLILIWPSSLQASGNFADGIQIKAGDALCTDTIG